MPTPTTRTYIAIDLKSFYASVECIERGLDPLKTNLVVADVSRTEKTICLAVSPSLKSYGIPGRPRLFEVVQKVKEINLHRKNKAPLDSFYGKSENIDELNENPNLELSYIAAPPQMSHYIKKSTDIYRIYLKYISPEDIHVYSIDEVFMDVTGYLNTYKLTARELAVKMIHDVLSETGITATAGIGTNMYLAKIAMDIEAKHIQADKDGVRIAELDEMTFRKKLWNHKPLTDFWRIGRGTEARLSRIGLYTMGDIARQSVKNEEILYKTFGINAELLTDHAWGWEPCTIAHVKAYKSKNSSLGSGQVLTCAYTNEKARIVVMEMADQLCLDLTAKGLVTNQIVLTVGYDIENLVDEKISSKYSGEVIKNYYGKEIPKPVAGRITLDGWYASANVIVNATLKLFDSITDTNLLIRRLNITAGRVLTEEDAQKEIKANPKNPELDLFGDQEENKKIEEQKKVREKKSLALQKMALNIKEKYGKNAILKGVDYIEGATARERNNQIGGHKA